MIKIKYHYTDEFRRKGFTIKGHADFAPIGQDIVCSAVTSNAIGVINSLDTLAKVKFDSVIGQEGFIECLVHEESLNEKTDLLLEHFELTMKSIQQDYRNNIKILKK
ncbi:ribosomal-processing cysteine protease Prp [Terrisporobacter petrolearius]|uniref:ribosomal-processing cysteine protease Prp n=1 Tax=Terrisporobacter petrolearius TaxID=1460447 RepID=UPI0031CC7AF2